MTREHTVAVKLKEGQGAVTFCAGHNHELTLKSDEVATKWRNGSPITRAEFDAILAREGMFEITTENAVTKGE